jgi:hypothetical protein
MFYFNLWTTKNGFVVLVHVACGLRVVLLGSRVSPTVANCVFVSLAVLGLVAATLICVAVQVREHPDDLRFELSRSTPNCYLAFRREQVVSCPHKGRAHLHPSRVLIRINLFRLSCGPGTHEGGYP